MIYKGRRLGMFEDVRTSFARLGWACIARLHTGVPEISRAMRTQPSSDQSSALPVASPKSSVETTDSAPTVFAGEMAYANRPISGTPVERAICIGHLTRDYKSLVASCHEQLCSRSLNRQSQPRSLRSLALPVVPKQRYIHKLTRKQVYQYAAG